MVLSVRYITGSSWSLVMTSCFTGVEQINFFLSIHELTGYFEKK